MKNNHIYTLIFIVLVSFTGYGQLSSTGNSKGGPTYPPPTRDSETCFCFEFYSDPSGLINAYSNLVEAQYQAFYQAQRNAIKNEIEQRYNENYGNYEQAVKDLFKREATYDYENDYINNLEAPIPALIAETAELGQITHDMSNLFHQVWGNNSSIDFQGLKHNNQLLEDMSQPEAWHLYNNVYGTQMNEMYDDANNLTARYNTLGHLNNNNLLADYLANQMWLHHKSYSDYEEIQQISAYLIYYANTNAPGPHVNTPGLFDGLDYYSYAAFEFLSDNIIENMISSNNVGGTIPYWEFESDINVLKEIYSTTEQNLGTPTYNFLRNNPNTIPGSAGFMANSDFSPYSIFNVQDIIANFQSGDQLVPTFASYGEDVSGQTLDRPDRIFYMQWDNDGISAGYQHAGLLLEELSDIPNNFNDGVGIVNFLDQNVPGFSPNSNIDYGKLFDFNYTGGGFTIKFSPYAMQHIIGDLEHADGIYGWDLFLDPFKIEALILLSLGETVSFNVSELAIDLIENINDENLNECHRGIFNQLKSLQDSDLSKIISRFFPTSQYNLEIKTETLPPINLGSTNWKAATNGSAIPYEYIIKISDLPSSATNLSLAQTIIHEIIHALFLSYADDLLQTGDNELEDNFPELWNWYLSNRYGNNANTVHHETLANKYVDIIARALQEFNTGVPVGGDETPQQVYSDMAWGGLTSTEIFNTMHPVGSASRQRIEDRIFAETFNTTTGSQIPIGSPCN